MKPEPGQLFWARLAHRAPPGHEQEGWRPVLLVGVPAKLGKPRFSSLIVVPVTTHRRQAWAKQSPRLYPLLEPGAGNLPRQSIVLLDQLQVIDARRAARYIGKLKEKEYTPIRTSLITLLGGSSS